MSKVLEELARHPVVQDTLRHEVTQAILEYPGSSLHDKINELTYLDAVIRETLRLSVHSSMQLLMFINHLTRHQQISTRCQNGTHVKIETSSVIRMCSTDNLSFV